MVDHIFNEARSGELLQALRAEGERARLARQCPRSSRTPRCAHARELAGAVAACLLAAIEAGLLTRM